MANKSAAEAAENLNNLINNNGQLIEESKVNLENTLSEMSINNEVTPEAAIKSQITSITRPLGPEISQHEVAKPSTEEDKQSVASNDSSLSLNDLFTSTMREKWDEIEIDLKKAADWLEETLEQEEYAFQKLREFVKKYGVPACNVAANWIQYAKDRFKEKRAILPIQQKRTERQAAEARAREAAEAAELATRDAQRVAHEAREAIKRSQQEYENKLRALRAAQAEAGMSKEKLAMQSRYHCAVCGTEGTRLNSECAFQLFHYILDIEKKRGGTLFPNFP